MWSILVDENSQAPLGISEYTWKNRGHKWIHDTFYDGYKRPLMFRTKLPSGRFDYKFSPGIPEVPSDDIQRMVSSDRGVDKWVGSYFYDSDGVIIFVRWDLNVYKKVVNKTPLLKRPHDGDFQESTLSPPPILVVSDPSAVLPPQPSAVLPPQPSAVPLPQPSAVLPPQPSAVPPPPISIVSVNHHHHHKLTHSFPPPLSQTVQENESEDYIEVVPISRYIINFKKSRKLTIMERRCDTLNPGKFIYDVAESLPVVEFDPSEIVALEKLAKEQNHTDSWFEDYFYNSYGQIILTRLRDNRGDFQYMHVKNG